ncbi:MAG TPA: CHAD domain-containing protein [Candidatus Hydrogenedentes bacterium]|jgi:CHAD domain-containing protein|nr:CHAD domain-containing protein [Candidatus Hydrogenedentota bacterium]HPJ98914.1 CHAD domain-containing protein [Candidatus Hydrogenedentota bacterium]
MAYALEASEAAAGGLKRVALEQLDQALASARNPGTQRDEAVHDVRKCMKKLRAILRMAREELGEGVFKRENACFRDAAQRLSGLREAAVRMATAEKLQTHFGGQDSGLFIPLISNLQALAEQARREHLDESDALCEVAAMLDGARARVDGWPLSGRGFSAVANGVRRIYQQGRKGLRLARKKATDEQFHEWRKAVKYLWYHGRLLQSIWPAMMSVLVEELDVLGDTLGQDHDLADLRVALIQTPALAGAPPAFETVLHLGAQRQDELRRAALSLGARLYAEKPRAFVDRLGVYWKVSHAPPAG